MKKLILYFILCFQFIFFNSHAQLPNWLWAKSIGQPSMWDDLGGAITTDIDGNIYIAGYFEGIMDFDPGVGTYYISSFTLSDDFILKMDSSGNFLWAKTVVNANNGVATIVVDVSGNVYATGAFDDTLDFDPGPGVYNLAPVGNSDIYVMKLDASGNFVWAKTMGGFGYDLGQSLALDALNNIYISGSFYLTADFDPGPGTFNITSAGADDIFVSKLDSAGNFIWAKSFENTGNGYGYAIAINPTLSSDVYLAGSFRGTTDFDPGQGVFNLASSGNNNDIFVSKLDSGGNFTWAKSMGSGASYDEAYSLALDPAGNGDVYIKGTFQDGFDFDPGPGVFYLINSGTVKSYICKLNDQGDFKWAIDLEGLSFKGSSLAIDISGKVYATGAFYGTADFDPGAGVHNITSAGDGDVYISCYDSAGNFLWVKTANGTGNDAGLALTIDPLGKIHITGEFESASLDLTPFTLVNTNGVGLRGDVIIAKLDSNFVTGINEPETFLNSISVYPNPFVDEINIKSYHPDSKVTSYIIRNTLNQIVAEQYFSSPTNQLKLDLEFLPEGMYFLELNTSKHNTITKIIKQKT